MLNPELNKSHLIINVRDWVKVVLRNKDALSCPFLYCKLLARIFSLHRGVKRPQCNFDFINTTGIRYNTELSESQV